MDLVPNDFSFAIVVANAQQEPATVTVASATNPKVTTATVQPGEVATLILPWIESLKNSNSTSVLEPSGAYHLSSSQPVTVYQFNALEYVLERDCEVDDREPDDGRCFSFTNDASLLLPEHALGNEYMVISRPTRAIRNKTIFGIPGDLSSSPGFFSVVAPKGNTTLTVAFSADTQAGTGSLSADEKGQTANFTLQRWEVLQILSKQPSSCETVYSDVNTEYCNLSETTDLTGTVITADKEIAVFSGHDCAFVPFHKWACDHLEEQLFPTHSLGRQYILSHTRSSEGNPSLYRIVSAEDGNEISIAPPSLHEPFELNAGQWVEIATAEDLMVTGTGRLAVAQFMVGQRYSANVSLYGDPSMALAVPLEQYRTNYRFLAPATYEQNYLNVVARKEATVILDGVAIDEADFKQFGPDHKIAKLKISGGPHFAEAATPFGIAVYGVGSFTSYMFPGGLDLNRLY